MASLANLKSAPIAQGAAGTDVIIAAAPAGYRHVIYGYVLTLSATGTVKFTTTGIGDLSGAMDVLAGGGMAIVSGDEDFPLFVCNPAGSFSVVSTVGAARGHVLYTTVSA